jgi:ArsR family transcriptional regulator, nickel/cobalt-responsive transcriptional repressor
MAAMTPEACSARLVELLDAPFLRALVEPSRLEVFRALLVKGPSDVGEIADVLPQHRSVVSRHLRTLEEAGIVHGERDGRRHVYAIDGAALIGCLEILLREAKALVAVCCPPAKATSIRETSDTRRGRSSARR